MTMKISDVDKRIIAVMQQNARQSYRQIAKQIKSSVATVMHHVKALEKEGILKKHATRVNYEKLGYDVEIITEIRISKGKLLEVEKKIASHQNVFGVYDVTGDFDALILARFKNRRQMDAFLKKVQTYEFVERTKTRLVLNTIKEEDVKISP